VTAAADDGHTVTKVARTAWRRLVLRARIRQGASRMRSSFWPIVQSAAAAAASYAIALYGLGHPAPFFAPVCAWACLGFSQDRELRKVLELAIGVAIGVGFGDLLVHFIGSGWWQISLVLVVSALVARFLDRGVMLTTQAGIQAIVIVGLPAVSAAGPLGRWTDALVGGAVALVVAALTPGDPRRRPRRLGAEVTTELAKCLDLIARGLRTGSEDDIEAALVRGRASEAGYEEWLAAARAARDVARISARRRQRRLAELALLERQAVLIDRAMNGIRSLARRTLAIPAGEHDLTPVAEIVTHVATGVRTLAEAIGAGRDPAVAREFLLMAAGTVDAHTVGDGDWQVQSMVLLLRSPLVDVLEVAGASPQAARDALPEL
jgi:uncharacterized membrane protein YgaE (UPF0421/DUF939 family)